MIISSRILYVTIKKKEISFFKSEVDPERCLIASEADVTREKTYKRIIQALKIMILRNT